MNPITRAEFIAEQFTQARRSAAARKRDGVRWLARISELEQLLPPEEAGAAELVRLRLEYGALDLEMQRQGFAGTPDTDGEPLAVVLAGQLSYLAYLGLQDLGDRAVPALISAFSSAPAGGWERGIILGLLAPLTHRTLRSFYAGLTDAEVRACVRARHQRITEAFQAAVPELSLADEEVEQRTQVALRAIRGLAAPR